MVPSSASAPVILALETATTCGSLALVAEGRCLAEYSLNAASTHSRRLLSGIDWLLAQCELSWPQIGAIAVSLGVLNLFPIPILDGGHLVFFAVEAIRRKPLSVETRERLQMVGLVLLISLMLFVFYNDFRFLGNGG